MFLLHIVQACNTIGIDPSPSLKSSLANECNPNRGVQILIVGEENDELGPGGCRALVNAMIGKMIYSSESSKQQLYTATKDLRILTELRGYINDMSWYSKDDSRCFLLWYIYSYLCKDEMSAHKRLGEILDANI